MIHRFWIVQNQTMADRKEQRIQFLSANQILMLRHTHPFAQPAQHK
jgi:hypothetical protein